MTHVVGGVHDRSSLSSSGLLCLIVAFLWALVHATHLQGILSWGTFQRVVALALCGRDPGFRRRGADLTMAIPSTAVTCDGLGVATLIL